MKEGQSGQKGFTDIRIFHSLVVANRWLALIQIPFALLGLLNE